MVRVQGRNIIELADLPIGRLRQGAASFAFSRPHGETVADKIVKEIRDRLEIMEPAGDVLPPLGRPTVSLSGGEAQRVRLAAQIGAGLRGVLYVLDEPTIGLHQRDNGRLISMLKGLRDAGNTIVVVEHDEQTIRAADHILDLGPGAGEGGGFKVAEGTLARILGSSGLAHGPVPARRERCVPVPATRRRAGGLADRTRGDRA